MNAEGVICSETTPVLNLRVYSPPIDKMMTVVNDNAKLAEGMISDSVM